MKCRKCDRNKATIGTLCAGCNDARDQFRDWLCEMFTEMANEHGEKLVEVAPGHWRIEDGPKH